MASGKNDPHFDENMLLSYAWSIADFPQITEHLKECKFCQSNLEDVIRRIRMAEAD